MQLISTEFEGLFIIEPVVHRDSRGFFLETFREEFFIKHGIQFPFVQANQAFSKDKGILRGLHFQKPPTTQSKLVWVTSGEVLDVVVDLRSNSATYGKHYAIHLSADNFKRFFIPKGFAHGYLTLTPDVNFNYFVDEYYSPQDEGGLLWNDPALGINWPLHGKQPILAEKDTRYPYLAELDNPF